MVASRRMEQTTNRKTKITTTQKGKSMSISLTTVCVLALLLVIIIIAFVDYFVRVNFEQFECKHCFAEFQSKGFRECIDCGLRESIHKPHYPKHQR